MEEELKRLVRGFCAFARAWNSLSETAALDGNPGRASFAASKEISYRIACYDAWAIHEGLGLTWNANETPEVKEPQVSFFFVSKLQYLIRFFAEYVSYTCIEHSSCCRYIYRGLSVRCTWYPMHLAYDSVGIRCTWYPLHLVSDSLGICCTWYPIHVVYDAPGFTWYTMHLVYDSPGIRFTWYTMHLVSNSSHGQ